MCYYINLFSLSFGRDTLGQLRSSCFHAAARWDSRHNDFYPLGRQCLCDTTPVFQAGKKFPSESEFAEAEETMSEDDRVFLHACQRRGRD